MGKLNTGFKKLNKAKVGQAIDMYKKGLSLQDIGCFFDVSRQSIHSLLSKRIQLRSNKKFGKENHFFRGGSRSDKRAQTIIEKAIKKGIIIPSPKCQECKERQKFKDGRHGIQAHHDNYNFPLKVQWLCQRCHHKWHKNNEPIIRKK